MMLRAKLLVSIFLSLMVSLPFPLGGSEVSADPPAPSDPSAVPAQAGARQAGGTPFPLFPGLEESVEFWKLVFTRYSISEVIFHDPLEATKIYKVLEVGESRAARRLIEAEREKIMREHGLRPNEKKVRAQWGVKERFVSGLKLSRRYLDQMQRIFQEEGLPMELTYLPLVESSFDLHARSRAGALGIWQFMPSTGKRFLRITPTVDERRDPMESTRAAARFLKENYELFGNWPLAITAYNHGREGILRAVREVGSKDLMEIIRRYQGPFFGFASKSFYAEFLAAVEVARRSEEFFPNVEYHSPFPLEELQMERAISIAALLKPTAISQSEFLEWNPALSPKIKDIPSGYRVKVPPEKLEIFLTAYQQIVEPSFIKRKTPSLGERSVSWIRHRVAEGETLSQIAKHYRISVGEIQRANRLANTHLIAAGQHLKIPKP
ncbi:MAG: transglycosylase SLT domain-containing protein [Deltaproteobacteria bacterium]|nr:transglycosylase SLT domain-containing protein [Deltaproteobacteria bacterium]